MANAYAGTFHNNSVCEGDTIKAAIDGIEYVARIVRDSDCTQPDRRDAGFWPSLDPKDAGYMGEGYSAADLEAAHKACQAIFDAWRNDEWFYCGVVISAYKTIELKTECGYVRKERICLGEYAASLWGIECNHPNGGNDYLTTVANDLLEEAKDYTRQVMASLVGENEATACLQNLVYRDLIKDTNGDHMDEVLAIIKADN